MYAGLVLASALTDRVTVAADRALIMTISEYGGSAALPGVKNDAANAQKILAGFGYSADHVRRLQDGALTLNGMRQALGQLESETTDGDRAFVYFSGHGTSYSVGDHCEQALVSVDMKPFPAKEMFTFLTALRDRTSRVVVVLDACFSGGVAETVAKSAPLQRSLARFAPKYWKIPEGAHSCSTPVNVPANLLAGLRGLKGAINLERNYAVVAAARDNEVAFDDRQKGGVATTALVDCLASPIADTDQSGNVSFAELVSCAQERIRKEIPGEDTLRQHLVLTGNDGMPVMAAAARPAASTANPKATLRDVQQAADARWDVQAVPSVSSLRVKQDSFHVTVTSSRNGYVYVVYVGSDNREFLKLYPTDSTEPNVLQAGIPFTIPRIWRSEGPAGTDLLLVLVSSAPRDLASVFGRTLAAPATYSNARDLQGSLGGCQLRSTETCARTQSRNLSAVDSAQSGTGNYGASIVAVDEVNQ